MPPKPKFTRDEIVSAALSIVSESGPEGLTARSLGARLGSSARPIFTVFTGMDELQQAVREAAMQSFEAYAEKVIAYEPAFKRTGMQMVLFGAQQPRLYQLLFMQNTHAARFEDLSSALGHTAVESIEVLRRDYGLSLSDAQTLFETMWIFTFGTGALCATGMCRFSEEKLSALLSSEFTALIGSFKRGELSPAP